MESPAQNKLKVLVTGVDAYLGREIAGLLVSQNFEVFGIGSGKTPESLIGKRNFTFVDLSLAGPFPRYLPAFDYIFHQENDFKSSTNLFESPGLTPETQNIISLAQNNKSRVFLFVPISIDTSIYYDLQENIGQKDLIKLFLVGDVYGPGLDTPEGHTRDRSSTGPLSSLIAQAIQTDKIILENEGLKTIYPAFISDCLEVVEKAVFNTDPKNIHYLISQSPKTSLSVAYEIQNVARLILDKDLGLFFSGPQPAQHQESEPEIAIHHLSFSSGILLEEGLKTTFRFALENKLVKNISPRTSPIIDFVPAQSPQTSSPKNPGKLTSKLPRVPAGKKFLLIALIVLILVFAKLGFDLFWGAHQLKGAKSAALAGDFKKAQKNARTAENSFTAAGNKTKIFLYPLSFIVPKQTKSITYTLESASLTSGSFASFAKGAEALEKDLVFITSKDAKTEGLDLETPLANFKNASVLADRALKYQDYVLKNAFFKSELARYRKPLQDLGDLSQGGYELTATAPDIIGKGGKKSYLVLLQNNTELRPGGGFIGSLGQIDFDEGKLKSISVEDVYAADGQLKEKIEPPKELKEKLGVTQFYLRDSNWSPDFSLNSTTARDFYKKETGKSVDGVMALDLTFIGNVLEKLGPIKLPDYSEQITKDNLFERGEYYSEIGFFPGSTQKRDFFGTLTRNLIDKIITSKDASSWITLLQVAEQSLPQKHLLVSFENPVLSSLIRTNHWDNLQPPLDYKLDDTGSGYRDFLSLSEANLGANKVNRFLDRKLTYDVSVQRDADMVARLKITYTNNSQAETWPGGKYTALLKVYIPAGSTLTEYSNDTKASIKDVSVTTQNNLAVLSTYIEVPIKSTRAVTFTYHLPGTIPLGTSPFYNLYVSKQPGTLSDNLGFRFSLPAYLAIKSTSFDQAASGKQIIDFKTDLSVDRRFQLELVKK